MEERRRSHYQQVPVDAVAHGPISIFLSYAGQPINGEPMYTLRQFCAFAQISERYFHVLRAQGLAPDLTRDGKNLRITHEAATEWLKQRAERGLIS
jgi:hypothetical protein